ncbi:NADH-cytochrome b5 reductase 2, partial [Durusdinium trenchii]
MLGFVVPEVLTCNSSLPWSSYLRAVRSAVESSVFPQEPFEESVAIFHFWRGRAVSAVQELEFFGKKAEGKDAPKDSCLHGLVTALQVLGARSNGRERRQLLALAEDLLYFGSTDVLSSSPWPARRGDILKNLLVPLPAEGEVESWQPFSWSPVQPEKLPFVWPPAAKTSDGSGVEMNVQRFRLWLTDQHSVVSGEIAYLFTNYLKRFRVKVEKQSVSLYCRFHQVCFSDGRVAALLRHPRIYEIRPGAGFLDGFEQVENVGRDMDHIAREFYHLFRSPLRTVDAFLCSIPIFWCQLYQHFRKPILGVMDQPIFLFVQRQLRSAWLDRFEQLAQEPRNFFVCHTAFLQMQVQWQTGVRLPIVRYLAIQTAQWKWHPRHEAVLVIQQLPHRPFFLPLLKRFQEVNRLSLQMIGLEEVPSWKAHRPDRYKRLAEYHAAVVFPYDVHFMKLLELYSMGVPIFLPADFFMWSFSWTIADPAVMEPSLAQSDSLPPFCATKGLRHLAPDRCLELAAYSDLVRLPHMVYFRSFPDLLLQLATEKSLETRSSAMKDFQAKTTKEVLSFWESSLARLLR